LTSGKRTRDTLWIGGCVIPGTGQDDAEKILDPWLFINYFILHSLWIIDVTEFCTAFDFTAYQNKLKPSEYSV
jgi:hypothetical protein